MRCLTVLVLLGCVLLVACGSTGQPSGTATGAANPTSGGSDPALQFARCVRSHGVPNFPDPKSGGGIQIPDNINPESPSFRSARQACKQFLPDRAPPRGTSAQDRAAALNLSLCMRKHGVPQFPDPAFSPPRNAQAVLVMRGMVFAIPTSVNPKSPAFQRASRACGF
jgi:hypothetical protein